MYHGYSNNYNHIIQNYTRRATDP